MTDNKQDDAKKKGDNNEEEEDVGYTYGKCCDGYAACI